MSFQWALAITFRSLTALVLFGAAAYLGYQVERVGMRRGWNGRLWRYLTYRHHRVPQSEEERRNWHGVVWAWVATLLIFAVIWFSDPTRR